ncbi:uncharacterized protein LOC129704649 [Leucoraja erinacea]|uniref:uncharacterized protein LOC129704649 n=1 Tax=Leucoraja erinaceus TaxID=7782 RepID=UPI002458FD3F|nr:uncharacterized protein LOC129704649 [Leucoraja erinacea]
MENSAAPNSSLRRGRQPYLLPQEAKRRRLERYRLRRQRMIHIGLEVERWHQLRAELGLENNASLAKFLLDNYRSCHKFMKLSSNPNTGGNAFGITHESCTASSTSFSGIQRKLTIQTSETLKTPQRTFPELQSPVELSHCDTGDDNDNDEDSSNFTADSADEADYLLPDSFASSKLKDYTAEEEVLNFIDDEVISGEEESVPILVASTKVKSIHRMRTGIVFDACLMSLARKAFSTCENADCKSKVDLQLHIVATAMKVIGHCSQGHESTWWSQPLVQTIPAGNIQLASSIILSGNNYGKIALMLKFLNMLPIGHQSFLKIQKTHVQPSVLNYWRTMQAKHFRELAQPIVVIAHQYWNVHALSKKYLTHTMMDNATHKILEVQVIDVQNDARKLQNLEVSGFQQVFRRLMQNNLSISEMVTNADAELLSLMSEYY